MRKLAEKYAWADAGDLDWTVAVVQGQAAESVLAIYGGSPTTKLGELNFSDANADRNENFDDHAVLQLLTRDRYVVAIEPNGWTGNVPEIARRASADGAQFFSVYWSPSAFQVLQARDGKLIASFDPNFISLPAGANDLLPGWVGDDDFPLEQLKSSCLAALEAQTGLAFDRGWFDLKLPTYQIPDPDEMLRDAKTPRLP